MEVITRLIPYVRILLGLVYATNGLNWFVKIITPYPSMSDFVDFMPPPDIVGALIENGILFNMAKGVELVAGLMLIFNRGVPLALVVSMAVTVPVFIVDVFKPELRLRAFLMGTGSLTMNVALLMAWYHHFRPMMAWQANPTWKPDVEEVPQGDWLADLGGRISKALLPILIIVGAIIGTVITGWLLVMVVEHALDPKAIHEVREMVPRAKSTKH